MSLVALSEIKRYIITNIEEGYWKVDALVPTPQELSEAFDVKETVAINALAQLEQDGYLSHKQGKPFQVARKKFNMSFLEIRDLSDDIRDAGHVYHANIIRQHKIFASDSLNGIFINLKKNQLYEVFIVHFCDGEPLQLEQRWVNPDIVPDFILQNFSERSPGGWLMDNISLEYARNQVEALAMPAYEGALLEAAANSPALVLKRFTYQNNIAVSYSIFWHAGDRFLLFDML